MNLHKYIAFFFGGSGNSILNGEYNFVTYAFAFAISLFGFFFPLLHLRRTTHKVNEISSERQ